MKRDREFSVNSRFCLPARFQGTADDVASMVREAIGKMKFDVMLTTGELSAQPIGGLTVVVAEAPPPGACANQAAVDAAHVAALEGSLAGTLAARVAGAITDADEATAAARGCADDAGAADLFYRGTGWQALIVIARRHAVTAGETSMTRDWCARLAKAVRQAADNIAAAKVAP